MNSDETSIEESIQQQGLNAPRLNPEHIDSSIVSEEYHTFEGNKQMVCCLTLINGFTVIGEAACVSPENYDEKIGKRISRDDARNKIWQLEGYLLQQNLHDTRVKND